jgi:hypothetical protein
MWNVHRKYRSNDSSEPNCLDRHVTRCLSTSVLPALIRFVHLFGNLFDDESVAIIPLLRCSLRKVIFCCTYPRAVYCVALVIPRLDCNVGCPQAFYRHHGLLVGTGVDMYSQLLFDSGQPHSVCQDGQSASSVGVQWRCKCCPPNYFAMLQATFPGAHCFLLCYGGHIMFNICGHEPGK